MENSRWSAVGFFQQPSRYCLPVSSVPQDKSAVTLTPGDGGGWGGQCDMCLFSPLPDCFSCTPFVFSHLTLGGFLVNENNVFVLLGSLTFLVLWGYCFGTNVINYLAHVYSNWCLPCSFSAFWSSNSLYVWLLATLPQVCKSLSLSRISFQILFSWLQVHQFLRRCARWLLVAILAFFMSARHNFHTVKLILLRIQLY